MDIKVGINGFGRMGRLALRSGWGDEHFEFHRINENSCDSEVSAHLLKFDSVHGKFGPKCAGEKDELYVDSQRLLYSSESTINDVDWSDCDIVIESTGMFRKPEQLKAYFEQGVKKVVVAAPVEGALNIVYGVNDNLYNPEQHHLVTAASCTTNCLAPVIKVLNKKIGIVHGTMTTIHDITNTQHVVDKGHKDLRRARASGQSLIPTSTGSAKAITKIFPELEGKLNGLAVRVPLLNASLVDLVFEAEQSVTEDEVNQILKKAAKGKMKDVLGYEKRPLVSIDFRGNPKSAIVDSLSTMVVDGTQVKVLVWYDNEWGYVNRLIDIVAMVARSLKPAAGREAYKIAW
ncbi:MAG: ArsJ-associated glyceraldehyde-3-phosphate dehydrogenase [bacterium]